MKNLVIGFIAAAALLLAANVSPSAQCQTGLALSSAASGYMYYARMAVHFGDASSIPNDVVCSRSLLDDGESIVNVPIWAYNLHEGIDYAEFSVTSNESLGVFIPDGYLSVVSWSRTASAGMWRLNIVLQASSGVCGPARLGYAEVVRVAGNDPIWIDLAPNANTGRMLVRDIRGGYHSAFPPQHGGYLGSSYLYACQEPICEEPNTTAVGFDVATNGDCRVGVAWTAGGGNSTMVRWSTHRFPTGIEDGHLAFEIPTSPGQHYYRHHVEILSPATLFYTAFSLTRDAAGLIICDSFVECSAVDWIRLECEIATEETSWGAIKAIYR